MDSRRALSKSDNAATPVTPPARHISSNLSTPGSTFGKEEDAIILELTQRYVKAGIEGESHAQCCTKFTPNKARRHGDFRTWLPDYAAANEMVEDTWGRDYELWRNDVKDVDLGLLSDKLERIVREIYNNTLLVDAGNARLVLILPSLLPHPVLSRILQTLFERWAFPSITLLPVPATALVAAGVRSGLVVDIGWEETVITAVYEYREVRSERTTRAMKLLTQNIAKFVKSSLEPDHRLSLELIEDLVSRVGSYITQIVANHDATEDSSKSSIDIDWPNKGFIKPIMLDAHAIQQTMLTSLLDSEDTKHHDDEELPVHKAIYRCLLALPTDVRSVCISRLIFLGEVSENSSLTSTIINSLSNLVAIKGWADVEYVKASKSRTTASRTSQATAAPVEVAEKTTVANKRNLDKPVRPEKPLVEERYLREKAKHTYIPVQGVIRQIESLGVWEGASLLTALKVKSFVEIQRDRFLSHGLSGASRDMEVTTVQPKVTTLASRTKAGDRQSWTLSGWG